ncbi:MAG TPA: hypothetical protein VHF92_16565 [Geodermatophilus sp.]|nr:hypothetical protein [Geodermatophilus sp.]
MSAVAEAPVAPEVPAGTDRALARWRWVAALTAAAAGVLHVVAAADHLEVGELAVGFFLLTALAQVGFAVWLVVSSWAGNRPGRELVTVALIGTVGLIALYVVAHTTDLLSAFASTDGGGGGHEHDVAGRETTQFDPVTGLDFSQGMPTQSEGPVAMGGDAAAAGHAPSLLGTVTVATEVLTVVALTALLPGSWRRRAANALLALGALAWVLWFTGLLG